MELILHPWRPLWLSHLVYYEPSYFHASPQHSTLLNPLKVLLSLTLLAARLLLLLQWQCG